MNTVFRHAGDAIDYTPMTDVTAGTVLVMNQLVGVAQRDIPAHTTGALQLTGVFEFPKESGIDTDMAVGEWAYWNDSMNYVTKVDTHKIIGHVVRSATEDDTTILVRLFQ